MPVASGSLFTKIAAGFQEWTELGLVEGELPEMNGAQAEGCSPVASAYAAGHEVCRPVKPNTIAKSLAIGNPADGPYALDLARRTGGSVDAVTDEEIRAGIKLLAETTGVFTETAGGVTTAVLAKLAARGDIDPDERVVLVITGEGLKTLDAVRDTLRDLQDRPHAWRRSSARARGGGRLMAVLVKIPTQLRAAAEGRPRRGLRRDRAEALNGLYERYGELRERSPTRTARCGASSTFTSPAKTSASWTGSPRRPDGAELTICRVAGG